MQKFSSISSRASVLPIENIDTDRIIPGRFLITTESSGLGGHLFSDWRQTENADSGTGRALARATGEGRAILVTGHNFGCGSSREHAVWAILDVGIRVVISTGFADIFRANGLRGGLVLIELAPDQHRELVRVLEQHPDTDVRVDLADQQLSCGTLDIAFSFDPFAKHCITNGTDELEFLLGQSDEIRRYEEHHPARVHVVQVTP